MQPFILEGRLIGSKNFEEVHLVSYFKDSVDFSVKSRTVNVKDRTFKFEGFIRSPQSCHLFAEDSNYACTGKFFIEKGKQRINFNSDSTVRIPPTVYKSNSNAEFVSFFHQKEYFSKENIWYKTLDILSTKYKNKIPDSIMNIYRLSRNELYNERDSTLAVDTKRKKESVIPLWQIVNYTYEKGYSPIYKKIYSLIPKKYKDTEVGKYVAKRLAELSHTLPGTLFPKLELLDTGSRKKLAVLRNIKNKYTLIDFWYSHCGPCIVQFEHLKRLYTQYHQLSFEIIGISVDKLKYKDDWLRIIESKQLPWPQLWDVAGKEAANLSINIYPTNFLLDSDGKIIEKNLSPSELEAFLKVHLIYKDGE